MKVLPVFFFLGICLLAGCYNDTQQELYGVTSQNAPCDTSGVTYSNTVSVKSISAIISANCSSCHSASTAANNGGVILDNYAGLITQVNNGKLMGDITHSPGFNAMPVNAPMLDACTIAKIQHWIDMGKENN